MNGSLDAGIVIAGCGPGAPECVTPEVHALANQAHVLAGARRLLALFPGFRGTALPVTGDIESLLNDLEFHVEAGQRVVVLVTGDPGVCSLAQPVVRRFGADRCRIVPGISSVQVACARLALESTNVRVINAHAGTPTETPDSLAGEAAIAVVGGNARTWPWILSLAAQWADTHALHLCRQLTMPDEVVKPMSVSELSDLEPGGGLSVIVWVRREAEAPAVRGHESRRSKVYFVGAGPGDPELLTRKAERLLRSCRCCIWAGSLVNPSILDLLPPDAERHDSAGLTLDQIMAVIEDCHRHGVDVVRLHTGEPALFGAIGEQMARLNRLGIDYEVLPGISSFQAAAAALKCELTAPEISQAVLLTRAPGRTPVPSAQTLDKAAALQATLCIFLSTDRLEDVTRQLRPHYGDSCPVALVFHASWPDERILRGTLETLPGQVQAAGLTRTGMILVGPALAGTVGESRLYASDFGHGYRRAAPNPEDPA